MDIGFDIIQLKKRDLRRIRCDCKIIQGWEYYNHAMIPIAAPHEDPDLIPVKSGMIWCNKKALLARWTSNWDCGVNTGWWYLIREGPFDLGELTVSSRRNIRKALRNCRVEIINPAMYKEDMWRVYKEATVRYKNFTDRLTKTEFLKQIDGRSENEDYWAGFDNISGVMVGYAVFVIHENWVFFYISRYAAPYLKLRVSDALNAKALEFYLNEKKKQYVSDGTRSVFHKTNFQKYLIDHFGYRKAYCKLHVAYRKPIGILIKTIFPLRNFLKHFDNITVIHKLNSILAMEHIIREDRE